MFASDSANRSAAIGDPGGGARQQKGTRQARVLVVDDDVTVLEEVKSLLHEQGYAVECATDGAAAVDRLERGGIDLLLLDIVLPRLSGWGVLDWIQAGSTFPLSRVLIYSGTGLTEGAFGQCPAVSKWEPPQVLLQKIELLLSR
jgi:CheY-like chemotaxis protein